MQQQWLQELPLGPIEQFDPLLKGLSNDVYKLTSAGQHYVLKHFRFDVSYGLDRYQEIGVQSQLATQGIAPPVLHFDLELGLLLQPFIEASDLAAAALKDGEKIKILAEVSAHIHQLHIELPVWSLRERIELYCASLANFDAQQARLFSRRLNGYHELLDQFGMHSTLCHNDLAYHHIFVSQPQPLVIDWEYAGVGDRYFDLANSILINKLDGQQQRSFIHAYEGASGMRVKQNKLDNMLEFCELVNQLWYELYRHLQKQNHHD